MGCTCNKETKSEPAKKDGKPAQKEPRGAKKGKNGGKTPQSKPPVLGSPKAPPAASEGKDSVDMNISKGVYQVQLVGDACLYTSGEKSLTNLLQDKQILMTASSSQHSLLVDSNNVVYALGTDTHGQLGCGGDSHQVPVPIPFFESNKCTPRYIGCGEQHSIVVCSDAVYSFGRGYDGQLGNGFTDDVMLPTKVPFFELPSEIQSVSCGTHHVLVVYGGKLYGFGWNSCGQLMLGDTNNRHTPTKIPFFEERQVIGAACGAQHSVVLCKDAAYVGGSNRNGQLGIGREVQTVAVPLELRFFNSKTVLSASAWYHTVICCSDGVYSFGEGKHGVLGHSDTDDVFEPKMITDFQDKKPLQVSVCYSHTALLCDDGLYIWGASNTEPPSPSPPPLQCKVPLSGQARLIGLSFYTSLVALK